MTVGELLVKIRADTTGLVKGIGKATNKLVNLKSTIKGIAFGGLVLGAGMLAKKAIDIGINFEQSMANVNSVLGGSKEQLQELSRTAREFGEKTVFSASQVADAMYYLASAGYNADQVQQALNGTLTLAAATGSDLASTTETVVGVLNTFNLSADQADRVANVFAATIANSQATMDKLSISFQYAGPLAHQFGMSTEELSAMLGVLYNNGIDASMAGTALRMAMTRILSPTSKAQNLLNKYGIQLKDVHGKMLPFPDILKQFTGKQISANDAIEIFGVRAGPLMKMIIDNYNAYEQLTQAVTGTSKAQSMMDMQVNTTGGQLKMLKSKLEELALKFFQFAGPILNKVLDALIKFMDWLNGPGGQSLINFCKGVAKVFKVIGEAIAGFIFVLTNLIGFVRDIFAGDWKGAWQHIKDIFYGLFGDMIKKLPKLGRELVGKLATGIANAYKGFASVVNELWEIIKTAVKNWIKSIANLGKELIAGFWKGIKEKFDWLKDKVTNSFNSIKDKVKKAFGIGSPSKVFEEYGYSIMEGFALGIEKGTPIAVDKVKAFQEKVARIRREGIQVGKYSSAYEYELRKQFEETKRYVANYAKTHVNLPKDMTEYLTMTFEEYKKRNLPTPLTVPKIPNRPYVSEAERAYWQAQRQIYQRQVNVYIGQYASRLTPEQLAYILGKEVTHDYDVKVNPV